MINIIRVGLVDNSIKRTHDSGIHGGWAVGVGWCTMQSRHVAMFVRSVNGPNQSNISTPFYSLRSCSQLIITHSPEESWWHDSRSTSCLLVSMPASDVVTKRTTCFCEKCFCNVSEIENSATSATSRSFLILTKTCFWPELHQYGAELSLLIAAKPFTLHQAKTTIHVSDRKSKIWRILSHTISTQR